MSKDEPKDIYINIGKDIAYHFVSDTLFVHGTLVLEHCAGFANNTIKELKSIAPKQIIFNLSQLNDIDSAGVTSLYYVQKKLAQFDKDIVFIGGSETIASKMELFKPDKLVKASAPKKIGFFERIGESVFDFFQSYLYSFLTLAADISYWTIADLFRSKARRKGEVTNQSVLIGVNAVLIVTFMSFIIGLVLALQTAQQLRDFGANIYIVDLTVVGMMSQMGPLITAILVAGRSGSAIAAEIATMKVTSELDALKTMGLDPIRYVVVPKMYACLLTMPFLVFLAIVAGIIGGAITANFYLDITPEIFINRMVIAIDNEDYFVSLVKSIAYASLIVLTGSFYGFRVVRGAEGVGKVTTNAVVVAISLVIVADSLIGLIFY